MAGFGLQTLRLPRAPFGRKRPQFFVGEKPIQSQVVDVLIQNFAG